MDVFALLNDSYAGQPVDKLQHTKQALSQYLNELLLNDFSALVQLLYRVDVPEKKVKEVLKAHPECDAGELMADLLIERIQEKRATKETFRPSERESGEERW